MKTSKLLQTSVLALTAALPFGCSAPGGPGAFPAEPPGVANMGGAGTPPPQALTCTPARASESLVARSSAMGGASSNKPSVMFTQDLFGLFRSHCGACHIDASQGDFNVTSTNFRTKIDDLVLATIKSEDINKVMPPPAAGGKPFSQRPANDPVVELSKLLELWKAQGRPADLFNLPKTNSQGTNSYRLPSDVGDKLTNLGNCIPPATMFAQQAPAMDELDTKFAAATALPETLDQTDLTSFDSAELAQRGLVAYVPTYPLWTDSAGKLRYIRVPRGQSVKFNKDLQEFEIPTNTRFYKTFLKKVIDLSGKESYRKIETRVIVSRPDTVAPDGTIKINSLFGTYLWNDDESKAELLRDPLRNGQPFRDRLLTYVQDEPKAKKIIDSKPANLSFALNEENPDLLRHYAVPGSQRCIDCHMGGQALSSFVLGFSPLQVNRRADGTGGTYEHTGADEVNQLQRLIDYGIITGITSPSEVTLLEDSQGARKPRNQHELNAQAYILGNCAHCHNPRGFPSKNPELKEALDFLPRKDNGGIFQFPLERYSKVRKRGAGQDIPMPYITPSLTEYPVSEAPTANWIPKWTNCLINPESAQCVGKSTWVVHMHAPWRSLLYRNVDTPFTYADDFAIFPHMPMHSTSFDCRAPRLMAKWMVSIPAKRKRPQINEWIVPGVTFENVQTPFDTEPQPYEEALPTDPDWTRIEQRAADRLAEWEASQKNNYCPPDQDIVDRRINGAPGAPLVPADLELKDDQENVVLPRDAVPDRAHFLATDLTEAPGDWSPRNGAWKKVLVDGMGPDNQKFVADVLKEVRMTDELRNYALTEVPLGVWAEKPACAAKLASVPKVGSLPATARPSWVVDSRTPAEASLYMQRPGEAIFNTICRNCHGPQADSAGILAQAILDMTGGEARVANFKSGLFGPITGAGGNRQKVFMPVATPTATPEDWAARYLSWMALGGTERSLPPSLLSIVSVTGVLGEQRAPNKLAQVGSPNMLKLAYDLCLQVLTANAEDQAGSLNNVFSKGRINWSQQTALISRNGDADMWLKLCSLGNKPVVRVVIKQGAWTADSKLESLSIDPASSLFFANTFPADAKVLDHEGRVQTGITKDNHFPMCIAPPSAAERPFFNEFMKKNPLAGVEGATIPECPQSWFDARASSQLKVIRGGDQPDFVDRKIWATRGAANAGFAVFAYLDQFLKGASRPKPEYNRCEELP
ncbi:MAG: hypothetical protein SF187_11775 [Deltaproteobacteria bacterium]|nr:hypothetical protein [Deltaproteobacteria bacterium]